MCGAKAWTGGPVNSQIGLPWSEARVCTNYFGKLSHRVNQGGGKNHMITIRLNVLDMITIGLNIHLER